MRSGWAPVSCSREASWRSRIPGTVRDTVPRDELARPGEVLAADVVVVGAGAAGLYAALTAAAEGAQVAVVSATELAQTASYWAQGGLAAALAVDDSPELHLEDTERAGRGLMRPSAGEVLVHEAPRLIGELQKLRVRFDADRNGNLALGLEGGHSRRRIVHAGGSATGRRLVRQLSADVVRHENIEVLEGTRVAGLWSADERSRASSARTAARSRARGTILATGGAAALWSRTTNPPGSLGIGLALALAAGAALADMELVQFHPTAVKGIAGREGFLVTEAIRGEGATLLGPDGERFVDELAPRDEVARAIWELMQREQRRVGVARHAPRRPGALSERRRRAARRGPRSGDGARARSLPAAHYVMGGVASDLHGAHRRPRPLRRRRDRVHGAARRQPPGLELPVGVRRLRRARGARRARRAGAGARRPAAGAEPIAVPTWETREALWRDAGLVRDRAGLERLATDEHPLARAVARCALLREETRGAHVRSDFPSTAPTSTACTPSLHDGDPAFQRWQ